MGKRSNYNRRQQSSKNRDRQRHSNMNNDSVSDNSIPALTTQSEVRRINSHSAPRSPKKWQAPAEYGGRRVRYGGGASADEIEAVANEIFGGTYYRHETVTED